MMAGSNILDVFFPNRSSSSNIEDKAKKEQHIPDAFLPPELRNDPRYKNQECLQCELISASVMLASGMILANHKFWDAQQRQGKSVSPIYRTIIRAGAAGLVGLGLYKGARAMYKQLLPPDEDMSNGPY